MIIGISGLAGAGKTVLATHLVRRYDFRKVAFADSLKRACKEIFYLSDEQVFGELKETVDPYWGVTPRFILQKVGTECMRNIYDKDIWIKSLGAKIKTNQYIDYVLDDLRFINEICAVKEWGGKVIKIVRKNAGAKGGIEGHASETELLMYNNWDYTIYNDGTLEDLYRKVDNLMRLLKPQE